METFEQIRRNDDDASIDVENPYSPFINSMTEELEFFGLNPLSDKCSIYRVRKRLRELNEKVYTPQVVSIGPLHHGREDLEAMEVHKKRYLNDFLQRARVSLDDFVNLIRKKEKELRDCYAEPIALNSVDFVKMILVDAVFIIEVLIRCSLQERRTTDRIYTQPYMIFEIKLDMCLLENQLPFFILEEVFSKANLGLSSSLFELAREFFKLMHLSVIEDLLGNDSSLKVEHLVDLLRYWHLPPSRSKETNNEMIKTLTIPSVTELHQAGVKFELASSHSLFDLQFQYGILKIPKLKIHQPTEIILKNLLAFERCHCNDLYINDYVIIINYLVNSPKDVELLVQNGIIENLMENSEAVSTLFQKLGKSASFNPESFYFSALIKDLNAHCSSPLHKWKATLKQKYFHNPWAIISVIAAVILLVLTLIQAVCSIMSV